MSFTGLTQPYLSAQIAPKEDFYVNQLRLQVTLVDMMLVFGTTEDIGIGQIGQRDRVCVRISPSMAKIVVMNLQAALDAFEDTLGPIPFSEAIQKQVDASRKHLTQALQAGITQSAAADPVFSPHATISPSASPPPSEQSAPVAPETKPRAARRHPSSRRSAQTPGQE